MFVTVSSIPVHDEHYFIFLWCRKWQVSPGTFSIFFKIDLLLWDVQMFTWTVPDTNQFTWDFWLNLGRWSSYRWSNPGTPRITEALFCPFSPTLPRSQDVLQAPCYLFPVEHSEGHNIPIRTGQTMLHQQSYLASFYRPHNTGRCLACPPITLHYVVSKNCCLLGCDAV
jgi:hypothetical protein